jgi:hypothetical protein
MLCSSGPAHAVTIASMSDRRAAARQPVVSYAQVRHRITARCSMCRLSLVVPFQPGLGLSRLLREAIINQCSMRTRIIWITSRQN